MHPLHKLGTAKTVANYHEHYPKLLKIVLPMEPLAALTLQHPMSLLKPSASFEVRNRDPVQPKACGMVKALNKSNLPPLPSTRQCPAYPFWMPTRTIKKNNNWETQLSMQYDHDSHQQNRLPRITRYLHGYKQQRTDDHAKSPDFWNSWN